MKYRHKETDELIDAYQYTGKNGFLLQQWSHGRVNAMDYLEGMMMIETWEGEMQADQDDYIIKANNGEFHSCTPGIFEKSYEPIEEK